MLEATHDATLGSGRVYVLLKVNEVRGIEVMARLIQTS